MNPKPTLRAALYVRVSTEEQEQSIETQETNARAFCARQGWEVERVYADVGVSGANFTTRPGLLRVLGDVRATPRPWDVLVIQRQDRLGRDAARSILALEEIHEAGAEVWSYTDGSRVELDPMGKVMTTMRGAFAEMERALIVARVTEGLRAAAEARRATGGRCYGYRTERTPEGPRMVVYEPEAAMVRWLFTERVKGRGLRELVCDLNGRKVPPPRTGTGSWSPSAIHEILHRVRYKGLVEYGRTHKGYRAGRKVRAETPERVLTVEAPELRIVSDELWEAAQSDPTPARSKRRGREPRYLLTGMARCSTCGGPIQVSRSKRGKVSVPVYLCAWQRDRGPTVCTNKLRRPVEEIEGAVLRFLDVHLFSPSMVSAVLGHVRDEFAAMHAKPDTERAELHRELARAQNQVERLADALLAADAKPDVVMRRLNEGEARVKELRAKLDASRTVGAVVQRWDTIETATRTRLGEFAARIGRDMASAREVLGALLRAPLRCTATETPTGRRYRVQGAIYLPLELDVLDGLDTTSSGVVGGAPRIGDQSAGDGLGTPLSTVTQKF